MYYNRLVIYKGDATLAEIKRSQLDELENLVFELNCITYLLSLVQYDKNCGYILIKEFSFLKGVEDYLTIRQIDTVLKLNDLFNSM